MQVNAISAYHNNINFEGRKAKKNKPVTVQQPVQQPKHASKLPLYTAIALIPVGVGMTSCEPYIKVNASAEAEAKVIITDTIPVIPPHDTDTVHTTDTIIKNDTIYIPQEFQFPYKLSDSINIWRGEYLDTPVEGDDPDNFKGKALLYMSALRQWDYNKHESVKLNLQKSDSTELRFDHKIYDPITGALLTKNDIRVTEVKPGDITVIREDGTETKNASGLLFNEDGVKTFAHSNGKDKIFVYDKQTSGPDMGKYVFRGTVEPGYLTNPQYGENILLNGIISEDTEDHYINAKGKVMDVADIAAMEPEERLTLE